MFYWLTELYDKVSFLNVFRYITFRTGGAIVTALVFVFLFGGPIIDLASQAGQVSHPQRRPAVAPDKVGTPTMGPYDLSGLA